MGKWIILRFFYDLNVVKLSSIIARIDCIVGGVNRSPYVGIVVGIRVRVIVILIRIILIIVALILVCLSRIYVSVGRILSHRTIETVIFRVA